MARLVVFFLLAAPTTAHAQARDASGAAAIAHHSAKVLFEQGDLEGAVPFYRRAIELDPQRLAAHLELGVALFQLGEVDGALAAFRTVLRLDPEHALVHSYLGNVLYSRRDVEGAVRSYRRAIELDPD